MYKNFNLTEEERKRIMEMHQSYGYKKPLNEEEAPLDEGAPEPVRGERQMFGMFSFAEGETKPRYYRGRPIAQKDIDVMVNNLAQFLTNTGTVETLRTFRNSPRFRIPQFIELHVGTSHSGTGETNAAVAQGRFNFLTGIVMAAFKQIGVDASVAKSVVVNKSDNTYAPSNLDRNFYDPKLVKPSATERLAWITVTALETEGNTMGGLMAIQKGLNQSSSIVNSLFVDGVDETKILQYLSKLKTFSDVEELDRLINSGGTRFDSLEEFLNDQLFDDPEQMRAAAVILQRCAMKSELQKDTVRLFKAGGNLNISIGIGQ